MSIVLSTPGHGWNVVFFVSVIILGMVVVLIAHAIQIYFRPGLWSDPAKKYLRIFIYVL